MIVFAAIIIFLFSLFVLSKEDFVFLRKNVALATIFDIAFFVGLGGLFLSRFVFALTHFSNAYFNPLVFFVIPYFPGLTASGLLIGGSIALYAIAMRKKLPLGKLFDVFSLALLPASSIIFLNDALHFFFQRQIAVGGVFLLLFLVVLSSVFILQKLSSTFSWSDGSASLLALSILAGGFSVSTMFGKNFVLLSPEFPYFLLFFFLLFSGFLVKTLKKARGSL